MKFGSQQREGSIVIVGVSIVEGVFDVNWEMSICHFERHSVIRLKALDRLLNEDWARLEMSEGQFLSNCIFKTVKIAAVKLAAEILFDLLTFFDHFS